MSKGGQIFQVIGGVHEGLYAQAPYSQQQPEFANANKLFVEFFHDDLCQKPFKKCDVNMNWLIGLEKLRRIGFYR